MTRSRFLLDADGRRIVRRELSDLGIEFRLMDDVAAERGIQHVMIRRIWKYAMCIGQARYGLLAGRDDAVRPDRIDRDL